MGKVDNGTIRIILTHFQYDERRLSEVVEDMREMGPPEIKAVWLPAYEAWYALEGCHRIRAAKALGLTPKIVRVKWSKTKRVIDYVGGDNFSDPYMTIEQFCDYVHRDPAILEFQNGNRGK